jgi:predicted metal-dependent phosphotriesterase family hydrolase
MQADFLADKIMTVTGPVKASELGTTLIHEHILTRTYEALSRKTRLTTLLEIKYIFPPRTNFDTKKARR